MKEYSLVKRGLNPIQYGKITSILLPGILAFPAEGEHDDCR